MATAPYIKLQEHRAGTSPYVIAAREPELAGGCVLLLPNTPLPAGSWISSRMTAGWMLVRHFTALEFEESLRRAGWYFTYRVGEIRSVAWGRTSKAAIERALRKAKRASEERRCNAIEIIAMRRKKAFGFHRIEINAVTRKVSRTPFLMELRPHVMARVVARERIRHIINSRRDPKLRSMTLRSIRRAA